MAIRCGTWWGSTIISVVPLASWTTMPAPVHSRTRTVKRNFREEHDEEKAAVEDEGGRVLEVVAAEKDELLVPDLHEHGEADGEGREAGHQRGELGEGLGDLEGDDEEGDCEREDGVAEALDAGDL